MQNSQENTDVRAPFLIKLKVSLVWVFSCELCQMFKNSFFYRTSLVTSSHMFKIMFSNDLVRTKSNCWKKQVCKTYCSKKFIWNLIFSKINPLSAKLTKWPNTLKQFVGNLPTNCLSVFGHFMGLALKGLKVDF